MHSFAIVHDATPHLPRIDSHAPMRPTLGNLSKALRLPLNSKKANKDFYKGTRTGNILRMKRVAYIDGEGKPQFDQHGRQKTWTKRRGITIDESRLDSYVVPPGLADTPVSIS